MPRCYFSLLLSKTFNKDTWSKTEVILILCEIRRCLKVEDGTVKCGAWNKGCTRYLSLEWAFALMVLN